MCYDELVESGVRCSRRLYEGRSVSRMLLEFIHPQSSKMRVKFSEGIEGAIKLASDSICTNRTKHMYLRIYLFTDTLDEGGIKLAPLSTQEQVANDLTRTLSAAALLKHLKSLLSLAKYICTVPAVLTGGGCKTWK